jgi:hypothetical protein
VKDRRFLPFDQLDEDEARAELDRRLIVTVLACRIAYANPTTRWNGSAANFPLNRRFEEGS